MGAPISARPGTRRYAAGRGIRGGWYPPVALGLVAGLLLAGPLSRSLGTARESPRQARDSLLREAVAEVVQGELRRMAREQLGVAAPGGAAPGGATLGVAPSGIVVSGAAPPSATVPASGRVLIILTGDLAAPDRGVAVSSVSVAGDSIAFPVPGQAAPGALVQSLRPMIGRLSRLEGAGVELLARPAAHHAGARGPPGWLAGQATADETAPEE
jgi:hypothetical protein